MELPEIKNAVSKIKNLSTDYTQRKKKSVNGNIQNKTEIEEIGRKFTERQWLV